MKKTIILSSAILALAFGSCSSSSTSEQKAGEGSQTVTLDTTKLKSGETFYQCEMDPDVISDQAGKCPKCGMELEKLIKK